MTELEELDQRLRNGSNLHIHYSGKTLGFVASLSGDEVTECMYAKGAGSLGAVLRQLERILNPEPAGACVKHEPDGRQYEMPRADGEGLVLHHGCKHCGVMFRLVS